MNEQVRITIGRWWLLAASAASIAVAIFISYRLPGTGGQLAALEASIVAAILALGFAAREASRLWKIHSADHEGWPTGPSRTSIALLIFGGLALSYHFHETGTWRFLHHLGIGLVVAGAVSAIWQLPEMKHFFVELAVAVMVDAKYLTQLHPEALSRMRAKSIDGMLRRRVSNPVYEIDGFTQWLDSLVIQKLLPAERSGSGMYRTDYRERVAVEFLTLKDVLTVMNVTASGDTETLNTRIIKQTSVATFRLVSPMHENRNHTAQIAVWAAQLPLIPAEKRATFRVGTSQSDAKVISLSVGDKPDPNGGLTFSAEYDVPLRDGLGNVWMETVEYRSAESESWVLNTFNMLTFRLDTHIYVLNSPEPLHFEGNVTGGLGSEPPTKTYLPNGMSFHYDGWLLEDHGYFTWWWKALALTKNKESGGALDQQHSSV